MKISITIPTYECKDFGWLFISELLNSIKKQSYKNYEVIISDQSIDNKIKKIVNFYSNEMDINYLNAKKISRSIGPNLNNAIKYAKGDLIKPMCHDDFFIDDTALEKIKNSFTTTTEWLVNGSAHCNSIHFLYEQIIPVYNHKIHYGYNTISSPSVLTIKTKEFFDENLKMLIDCEMYKRLYTKYGNPKIIIDPLICNRMHENQAQKEAFNSEKEKLYCINLYGE
jgi:glycosyltransferase involved in cell wall biosynthesis